MRTGMPSRHPRSPPRARRGGTGAGSTARPPRRPARSPRCGASPRSPGQGCRGRRRRAGLLALLFLGLGFRRCLRRGRLPLRRLGPLRYLSFGPFLTFLLTRLADQLGLGDLGGRFGSRGGYLFGPRRHDRRDREIGTGEDRGVGDLEVAHVPRMADGQRCDVELHAVGDVLGEHFDFDFAHHLVEHAAGVAHAVGGPHEVHGDLEADLLAAADLVKIDVDDVRPDGVALDLADQHVGFLPIDRQLDDGARGLDAGQRLLEGERIHGERLGGPAVAVDHRRDLVIPAGLAGAAFAAGGPRFGGESDDLSHVYSSDVRRLTSDVNRTASSPTGSSARTRSPWPSGRRWTALSAFRTSAPRGGGWYSSP